MRHLLIVFIFALGFSLPVKATTRFTCENSNYLLEIDEQTQKATVTHVSRPGTKFTTKEFKKSGQKVARYTVYGNAKALRYEGSPSEQWYQGEAVIRTYARLAGDDIVYSAEFLIDYDPYYTVTTWSECTLQ